MIAAYADVKVIKFCIHCNEVDTNTCDWLPIIYQTTEVGLCYFALDTERGDFSSLGNKRAGGGRKEKEHFFHLSRRHTQAVMSWCVREGTESEGGAQRMCGGFRQWM